MTGLSKFLTIAPSSPVYIYIYIYVCVVCVCVCVKFIFFLHINLHSIHYNGKAKKQTKFFNISANVFKIKKTSMIPLHKYLIKGQTADTAYKSKTQALRSK